MTEPRLDERRAERRVPLRGRIGAAGFVVLGLGIVLEAFASLGIEVARIGADGWGAWYEGPSFEATLARWADTWSYGIYRLAWAMIALGALAFLAAVTDAPRWRRRSGGAPTER